MSAGTNGDLAAVGSVRLVKDPKDNLAIVQIGGSAYAGLSFVVEGTIAFDPTSSDANWFALAAQRLDTQAVVTGTISPIDDSEQAWRVVCDGLTGIRARVTAVSSGTATFTLSSGFAANLLSFGNVLSGGTLSGATLTGSSLAGVTTVAGDVKEQIAAAAIDGAISLRSGTVFITKAGVASLTLADPVTEVDDGKTLCIIATTAEEHLVENLAGSGFNGDATDGLLATFGGDVGDNLVVKAYQGVWYVLSNTNVTLSALPE